MICRGADLSVTLKRERKADNGNGNFFAFLQHIQSISHITKGLALKRFTISKLYDTRIEHTYRGIAKLAAPQGFSWIRSDFLLRITQLFLLRLYLIPELSNPCHGCCPCCCHCSCYCPPPHNPPLRRCCHLLLQIYYHAKSEGHSFKIG